jgi:ferric-dicitrate binding protein FerR (iron transport regulator)
MDKKILYKHFQHKATFEEEKVVLEWLDEDKTHFDEYQKERKLYDMLLMTDASVVEQTNQEKKIQVYQWLKYAAIIILILGVGQIFYTQFSSNKTIELFTIISVPTGQRTNVLLPDGTEVCLNAKSTLQYSPQFSAKHREVKLTGEGYFKVKHDKDHPFLVKTSKCNIKVLGTEFDVVVGDEKQPFEVSLVEGRVLLHDNLNHEKDIIMHPDETVTYHQGKFKRMETSVYEDFSWREGILSFRNEKLKNLLEELENTYDVEFVSALTERMEGKTFSGKIRINEGVDHALWVLLRNSSYTYFRDVVNQNKIYIKKK